MLFSLSPSLSFTFLKKKIRMIYFLSKIHNSHPKGVVNLIQKKRRNKKYKKKIHIANCLERVTIGNLVIVSIWAAKFQQLKYQYVDFNIMLQNL